MILKKPKKPAFFQRFVGGLIIFETVCFAGSYFVWYKLNKSRDYRAKTRESAPWALEIYYKMGEFMDSKNKAIRQQDEDAWAAAKALGGSQVD